MYFLPSHILQRAAAPLSREQPAAGSLFRTLVLGVARHHVGIGPDPGGGWDLSVPRDLRLVFNARAPALLAPVALGTAVGPAGTAHRLGRRGEQEVTLSRQT